MGYDEILFRSLFFLFIKKNDFNVYSVDGTADVLLGVARMTARSFEFLTGRRYRDLADEDIIRLFRGVSAIAPGH